MAFLSTMAGTGLLHVVGMLGVATNLVRFLGGKWFAAWGISADAGFWFDVNMPDHFFFFRPVLP